MTRQGSSQSLTGRFTHFGRLLEVKPFRFSLCENGAAQRMLRVQFQAGGQCKNLLLCEVRSDELLGQFGFAVG